MGTLYYRYTPSSFFIKQQLFSFCVHEIFVGRVPRGVVSARALRIARIQNDTRPTNTGDLWPLSLRIQKPMEAPASMLSPDAPCTRSLRGGKRHPRFYHTGLAGKHCGRLGSKGVASFIHWWLPFTLCQIKKSTYTLSLRMQSNRVLVVHQTRFFGSGILY